MQTIPCVTAAGRSTTLLGIHVFGDVFCLIFDLFRRLVQPLAVGVVQTGCALHPTLCTTGGWHSFPRVKTAGD